MNFTAILHLPGAVDACPLEGNRMALRVRTAHADVKRVRLIYACNKGDWWRERETAELRCGFSDSEFDYYSVTIPLTDTRLGYIFELTASDGAVYYLSEDGITETYDHSQAHYTYFQYTSMFPCDQQQVPHWVPNAAAYQIFPERFDIGDRDRDLSYVNARWGELPTPISFYGGDLAGITRKMSYLAELGVRLLYLTPVFCSPSNHKYDIVDYENVDPRFGGNRALKALIAEAHLRGIRVMLDGVFNHCSSKHPFFQDVVKNGRESKYYDWFFVDGDFPDESRGNYRMFATVGYMPKLNTANPAVIDYFSSVAVRWMEEYGADCWRLDVSDEISHRFLRAFRERVTAARPDAIIIGEDWHQATRYLSGDEYDGTMNYGFTKACLDLLAFGTIDAPTFRDRLVRLYHRQNVAASAKQLNLIDSHDTDRFLTLVKGDHRKYRMAAAASFFYPGIPCVYYGDEIGTEGGYDPDCRRCFDWNESHWNAETHALIRRLMHMKQGAPLSRGVFGIEEADGVVTMTRTAGTETAILRLNPSEQTRGGLPPFEMEILEQKVEEETAL